MRVMETERLILRRLVIEDAAFIKELLNEPSWLRFIGDKGVRTLEDAQRYILTGPVDMYHRLGFGLFLTALKETDTPIGLCGLIKRDSLPDVDIGFAFLPKYWNCGYAYEAAAATIKYGKEVVGLPRIVAITTQDNHSSAKLLERIGLKFEKLVKFSDDAEELRLFGRDLID